MSKESLPELKYCCPTCLCKVATQLHLVEHYRIVHKKFLGTPEKPKKKKNKHVTLEPTIDTYAHPTCGETYVNPTHLLDHVESEHNDKCCEYDPPTKTQIYSAMLDTAPAEMLAVELERELEEMEKIKESPDDKYYDPNMGLWREVRVYGMKYHGWSEEESQDITRELFRALYCKQFVKGYRGSFNLGMPPLLDQAWHIAILNTIEYNSFCCDTLRLRQVIPHTTKSIEDPDEHKERRIKTTIQYYMELFGEDPPEAYWPVVRECKHPCKDKARCKHACCKRKGNTNKRKREPKPEVQLYIKTLYGAKYSMRVPEWYSVQRLFHDVSERSQENIDSIRLIYNGRQLEPTGNELIPLDWNEAPIYMVLKLRAC